MLGFTACLVGFPFSHGKKHPDHKSGWDLDSDKTRCTMTCWGYATDPNFLCTFSVDP